MQIPNALARKALTCPYCYESFTSQQIVFRCSGVRSRAGSRCTARVDDVLERHTGQRRMLNPVFLADGRRANAVCPDCGGETTTRVCPVCHSHLPAQFGQIGSLMIAMVGPKESGKTVYMTVLLHELMNRIGSRFSASVLAADDETARRFEQDYENQLYKYQRMPTTTVSAETTKNLVNPLVFKFTVPGRNPLGAVRQHTLLSFFDAAGEDLVTREGIDLNGRYLRSADGIILLVDPLQMPGARNQAGHGAWLPGSGPQYDPPASNLAKITDMLTRWPGAHRNGVVSVPTAVVFPKIDAFWHRMERGSPLNVEPPQGPRVDVADSLDVHTQTARLLKDWGGTQIDENLEGNFKRYRYFGVSALGGYPNEGERVSYSGIQPYRVADPFMWLLSELGVVGREGRG
jgi:Double-GTPase 2